MNYHRWSRIAEWGVVAAVFAFHGWTFIPGNTGEPESPLASVFAGCLPLCWLTLIGSWLLLGPGNPWLRGAVAGGGAASWAIFFTDRFPRVTYELPAIGQGTMVAFGVLTLSQIALLRLYGLSVASDSASRTTARHPQFSIRSLIIATTLIAAMLGALESSRPWLKDNTEVPWTMDLSRLQAQAAVRQVVMAAAQATICCGALFAILRPGALWLRLMSLAIAIPCLAGYLVHLSGSGDEATMRVVELATAFGALAGVIAITVLPLRLFGYRLMRRSAARTAAMRLPAKSETIAAPSVSLTARGAMS